MYKRLNKFPFLPIQFFKTKEILSSTNKIQETFSSSGTTGSITSKHHVTNLSWYETSYLKGFNYFYGDIKDYVVLALLPNYLERKGSSLVYMVDDLIKKSNQSESGFYLNNLEELAKKLLELDKKVEKHYLLEFLLLYWI